MKNLWLRFQLRTSGASAKEAKSLHALAKQVGRVDVPHLSSDAKNRIANEIGISTHKTIFTIPRLAVAGAAAVFALLIGFSQSAMPSSPLYSIKRGTEQVRLLLQPGFNQQDIQERRAEESQKIILPAPQTPVEKHTSDDSSKNSSKTDSSRKTESEKSGSSNSGENTSKSGSNSHDGNDDSSSGHGRD